MRRKNVELLFAGCKSERMPKDILSDETWLDMASLGCGPGPVRRCTETVNDKGNWVFLPFD